MSACSSSVIPQLWLRAMGHAEVLVGGQQVTWPARSAEELLWFLHTHPEGKYRHDILAQLWDLEDSPAAANRFRVALHRLRTALGRPDAVTEHAGRYVLHSDVLAASDTYALYSALREAHQATSPHLREAMLRQALASAEGEYLPHLQGDWVELARQKHRSVIVEGYLDLSRLHCEGRACQLSAQALVLAAGHDPLIGEDHHQRLMACLSMTRDKYAAIEHYRRYRYFLANEVGDTPMPETEDLAERIKSGEVLCKKEPFWK